jgi:hypothetical protein
MYVTLGGRLEFFKFVYPGRDGKRGPGKIRPLCCGDAGYCGYYEAWRVIRAALVLYAKEPSVGGGYEE